MKSPVSNQRIKMEKPSLGLEQAQWNQGHTRVAGVDEAGRGCLAGPVVAAAVVFAPNVFIPEVQDSKKLSAQKRDALSYIIRDKAVAVGVGLCSPEEIDTLNILWAAMEAMKRAVYDLEAPPDFLLIDGNTFAREAPWSYQTVVGGDRRSFTIAAASIIAKTTRDAFMKDLHDEFPQYGWDTNVGYPTKKHYTALREWGPTPYHRKSFRLFR